MTTVFGKSSLEAGHPPPPFVSTGARIEEFLYEKLDRTVPSRPNNGELLGHYMQDAAKDFGPGTPYGVYSGFVYTYSSQVVKI